MKIESMSLEGIRAFSIPDFPVVESKCNLSQIILQTLEEAGMNLQDDDIVVIASKIVSVSEGRIVDGNSVVPSENAKAIASKNDFDPIQVELALRESKEILRSDHVLITETKSGLICNFSGVDKSNAPENNYILLPEDPDASARYIRDKLMKSLRKHLAVIITDTQGRPWRKGSINIAIGSAGIAPFKYNKGKKDLYGRTLQRSTVCQVDEIAMLAEPVMGQAGQKTPVVIIRGYEYTDSDETARDIIRSKAEDMFR